MHWVSAEHSLKAEIRLYDRLFKEARPVVKDALDLKNKLNPDSVAILTRCRLEPSLAEAAPENKYQFERQGYFCADRFDSRPGKLVFNRTATLRDAWAKIEKAEKQKQTRAFEKKKKSN